ncbi:hypothetical protein Clacol_004312 [Clathrus columnatus]|uniref:Exonuclease domain-containing protein n=1 Tax=Clathrus columnatus TaxID=1419009 RepID=A0AAV5AC69_9AGAM|nr:hypothetical protein Clacol_004312 [Clathrus columnatus]
MKRATDRGSTSPQRGPPQTKKLRLDLDDSQQQHTNDMSPMKVFITKNDNNDSSSTTTLFDDSVPSSGMDGWTKVEKRKSKKVRNYEVRVSNNVPSMNYSTAGITARKEPISIGNPNSIQQVVVAQIPGLTNTLLNLPPLPTDPTMNPYLPIPISPPSPSSPPSSSSASIPFITQTFQHALPTRAPGEATKMHSVLGAFFMGPVSGEEKKRRILSRIEEGRKLIGEKDPSCYVLSAEEMCNQEYPIPSYMGDVSQLEMGWVESPEAEEEAEEDESMDGGGGAVKRLPKVFALDCEMVRYGSLSLGSHVADDAFSFPLPQCLTEDGKELTRVCVIDFYTEKVVLDELVKPIKPILDYLTRFSGITAEHLASVTTTLPLIQAKLVKMFTSRTILVGHSLEQDLRALKFAHARCIDTAVLYHHPRGRPLKPGLAWLTKKWCNREIQTGGEGGHDPEEDARACLELVKKKLANGPAFGEFKIDQESILERLARSTARGPRSVIKTAVVDYGNPSTWHGAKATIAIACKSDSDILNGMIEAVGQCQLVFGRFMELSEALGWSTSKTQIAEPPSIEDAVSSLDRRLKTLHQALPPRTALILFSGHSDPRTMASLSQRKAKFENDLRSGIAPDDIPKEERWTASDARALEEETAKARRGLAFLCLKREF